MRSFSIVFVIVLGLSAFLGCKTDNNIVTAKGSLQEQGITSYQYGTHVLESSSRLYALRSSEVVLDSFVGEIVTIKGTKVEGYPIEGGPVLLEVHTIKED